MHGTPLCALHHAEGTIEACPGSSCPFWEDGGAVVPAGCSFERLGLEFETRPGLARWLLGIRGQLEGAQTEEDVVAAHRLVNEFLPPGLRD
jgi:hypothetical protein